LALSLNIQPFDDFESETLALIKPQFKSKYGYRPMADLLKGSSERSYIAKGLISEGGLSMLAAPSMGGKSFIAINLALSVAQGIPFFGRKTTKGLVLYQAGEGQKGIRDRVRAHIEHHAIVDPAALPFAFLEVRIDIFKGLADAKAVAAEINAIKELYSDPLRLFIIDTFHSAAQGMNEIDGKDVGIVLANLETIKKETGVAIMLVHHMNADGTKTRGHTGLFAAMDEVLLIDVEEKEEWINADLRKKTTRTLHPKKIKDGPLDFKLIFELQQCVLGVDADGDNITSCVVVPAGSKDKRLELEAEGVKLFRPNAGEQTFLRALFRAIDDFGVDPPGVFDLAGSIKRVVDYEFVKKVFVSMNMRVEADDTTEKNRIKAALKRALDNLGNQGVVDSNRPYIWHTGKAVKGMPQTYPKTAPKKFKEKPRQDDDDDDTIPL
jgi:AAA domain